MYVFLWQLHEHHTTLIKVPVLQWTVHSHGKLRDHHRSLDLNPIENLFNIITEKKNGHNTLNKVELLKSFASCVAAVSNTNGQNAKTVIDNQCYIHHIFIYEVLLWANALIFCCLKMNVNNDFYSRSENKHFLQKRNVVILKNKLIVVFWNSSKAV